MLNIQFKKIILHNFGSYSHAEIDLQNKGFCLVSGINNCKLDNASSNGSGKSFIWSGICYALTGETINGLRTNLKNVNLPEEPEMYTELYFSTDGNDYIIKRGQVGSKYVSIHKNGEDISGKTYSESDAKVVEELPELTRELIANTIIIGQGMPNKFSSFTPSGRKELLEKLTKSDYMIEDLKTRIAARMEVLNNQLRVYENSLLVNNTKLSATNTNLINITNQINSAKKPDFANEIARINEHLNTVNKNIANAKKDLTAAEAKYDEINKSLLAKTGAKATKTTELNESYHAKLDPLQNRKVAIETEISGLNREIIKLESIKDVCPTCGHKLEGVTKPNTAEQHAKVKALTEELAALTPQITACNSKYAEYVATINKDFETDINTLNSNLSAAKREMESIKNNIAELSRYTEQDKAAIIKLESDQTNWDSWFEGLGKTAKTYEAEIKSLEDTIKLTTSGKEDTEAHVAVVKKMETLVKRDFRGYLLANIIAYIDQTAKDFAEIVFGTRELNIYVDGNNLDISYCGKMMDNLSGGEKTRVDLILQLAIRNMLQKYLNFNSNILVLDEITDFLDKTSCKAVMKLLSKELLTIESVFIISHHAEELELPIDSNLTVIKDEQGISTAS